MGSIYPPAGSPVRYPRNVHGSIVNVTVLTLTDPAIRELRNSARRPTSPVREEMGPGVGANSMKRCGDAGLLVLRYLFPD